MNVIHRIEKEGSFYYLLNAFLGAYNRRTDMLAKAPIGDTSIAQKLDTILKNQAAILDGQQSLAIAVADVPFMKEEVSTIHGIVASLDKTAELQKEIDELTAQLNAGNADVKDAIDQQTKGDK